LRIVREKRGEKSILENPERESEPLAAKRPPKVTVRDRAVEVWDRLSQNAFDLLISGTSRAAFDLIQVPAGPVPK